MSMNSLVLQLRPDLGAQDLHLLYFPFENRSEQSHRECLEAVYALHEVEETDVLLLGVSVWRVVLTQLERTVIPAVAPSARVPPAA